MIEKGGDRLMIRMIIGLILMIGSVGLYLFITQNPQNAPVLSNFIESTLCTTPGAQVVQTELPTREGPFSGLNLMRFRWACVGPGNASQDITDILNIASALIIIFPLFWGLSMTIRGVIGMTRHLLRPKDDVLGRGGAVIHDDYDKPKNKAKNSDAWGTTQTGQNFSSTHVTINGRQADLSEIPESLQGLFNSVMRGVSQTGPAGFFSISNITELVKQLDGLSQQGLVHPTGAGDLSDRLEQLKEAHDQGLLQDDEYARLRQQLLDNF